MKLAFDHSLQEVRTEAIALTTELHRWLGDSLLATIDEWELRPAQKKELEQTFKNNNAKSGKSTQPLTPDRRIRSSSVPVSPSPTVISGEPPSPVTTRRDRTTSEETPRKPSDKIPNDNDNRTTSKAQDNPSDISSSPPSISPTSFDTVEGDAAGLEINSDTESDEEPPMANFQRSENPPPKNDLLSQEPFANDTIVPVIPLRTFLDREDSGYPSVNILSTLSKAWYLEVVYKSIFR